MFKKQVKVSNSHSVANKDKKKLKDYLLALKYDAKSIDTFLDDKSYNDDELVMDKL